MARYFFNGKEQSSPRGRVFVEDGVIGRVVMLQGMTNTNGRNIEFLTNAVNELIGVVNNQHQEIEKLKTK